MYNSKLILMLLILLFSINCLAYQFADGTQYDVCFTPGEDCTAKLVKLINSAKHEVLVQAYSFTSAPIARALVDAKKNGISVKVILDKSQVKNNRYSSSKFLRNNDIPVWIDYKPAIAHNKVIIIDGNIVETGSFNYTKSAQLRNAENVLIIYNANLAKRYKENWLRRKRKSRFSGCGEKLIRNK